jgi:hypothetical protein
MQSKLPQLKNHQNKRVRNRRTQMYSLMVTDKLWQPMMLQQLQVRQLQV